MFTAGSCRRLPYYASLGRVGVCSGFDLGANEMGTQKEPVAGLTGKNKQLGLNATMADFDRINAAQAGFNVLAGDVIKVFIDDEPEPMRLAEIL